MKDVIIGLIIAAILFLSIRKIVVEKKKGTKCIGCPHGGSTEKDKDCGCK